LFGFHLILDSNNGKSPFFPLFTPFVPPFTPFCPFFDNYPKGNANDFIKLAPPLEAQKQNNKKKGKKERKRQNGKQKSAKNSEKLGKTELKNALKTLTKRAERQRTYPTNPYRYRFSCGYGYTAILLLFGGVFFLFRYPRR